MPGPVSSSYDPEFGTGERASIVCEAVTKMRDKVSRVLGKANAELLPIVDVCEGRNKLPKRGLILCERELRILRFALNRALESL